MANKFREKPVEERREEPRPKPSNEEKEEVVEAAASAEAAENSGSDGEPEASVKKPVKMGKAERTLSHVIGGDVLADVKVTRQIPLVLLVMLCFLAVVANRYNVERIIRDKAATEDNIVRLRERRIEMQKQYQQAVRISRIAEVLQESGVGITAGPPYEIEK